LQVQKDHKAAALGSLNKKSFTANGLTGSGCKISGLTTTSNTSLTATASAADGLQESAGNFNLSAASLGEGLSLREGDDDPVITEANDVTNIESNIPDSDINKDLVAESFANLPCSIKEDGQESFSSCANRSAGNILDPVPTGNESKNLLDNVDDTSETESNEARRMENEPETLENAGGNIVDDDKKVKIGEGL
jgi:hypothetical protein